MVDAVSNSEISPVKVKTASDWYTKHDAAMISAIGILLMIAHHLFGFKEYLAEGISWNSLFSIGGIEVERIIAAFGKICVSLFAFNSGYVIWKFRSSYRNLWNCFKRCASFLLGYWIVLALFMIYAALIGDPLPTGRYLIANLLGISTGPGMPFVNVPFAWYVTYYVIFLMLTPAIIWSLSKGTEVDCMLVLILGAILSRLHIGFMSPMMIGIEGVIFAKYSIFQRLATCISSISIYVIILIEAALIVIRQAYILFELNFLSLMGG